MVNPVSTELYTAIPIAAYVAETAQGKASPHAVEKTQADARNQGPLDPGTLNKATPNKDSDQVTLSADAQAQLLDQQGKSVTQIALLLGLSTATVDSYLGIQPGSAVVSQPVAAAAVPQGRPA